MHQNIGNDMVVNPLGTISSNAAGRFAAPDQVRLANQSQVSYMVED